MSTCYCSRCSRVESVMSAALCWNVQQAIPSRWKSLPCCAKKHRAECGPALRIHAHWVDCPTCVERHRASVCNTVCVTMKLWRSVRTVTMSFGALRTINQHHWIGSIGSPTSIHMMTLTYRRIWDWLQVKGQGHTAHTTRKCLSALTY